MMKAVSTRLCDSVSPARIGTLMRFGFTERQARFLVHVLVFSGAFLERQYRMFTGLAHDQKTHDFLASSSRPATRRRSPLAPCTAAGCITSSTSRSTRPSASRITATGRPPRWGASSSD